MKKSEFKEYLKNEVLKMTEASDEDISKQQELNKELEKTKELMGDMMEGEGSTITLDDKDMEMLHKNGKLDIDDHTVLYKMKEGKMKKSEFKEYLKNEILREIDEQEEEMEDIGVGVDLEGEEEGFDGSFEMEEEGATIEDLSDELVDLAKKAKNAGAIELANQILNSAKFANKTKIKSAEKEAGLSAEG